MRMNNEGSYYPPNDSLNDAIKAMEDIIKDTGESSKLSIGIDCNANNYFVETTKKYEMDGFKQPPEAEALIDFYLKFCHDHPLISYLEDPLADSDISGWNKIHSKFDSKSHIFVTSKSLVSRNLSSIQNLIEMKQLEEVLESQSEEEKKHVQEANKLKLQQNAGKVDLLNISLGMGSCVTVSELFDCHKIFRQKSHKGLSVWDAAGESDQHIAVDLAFAMKANYLILHGLNNRSERMIKVNRYLELIEKFY
jgi:enolase